MSVIASKTHTMALNVFMFNTQMDYTLTIYLIAKRLRFL